MQLIKTCTNGEDLRQENWQTIDYKSDGSFLIMTHLDKAKNKKCQTKTRFAGYDDAFGKPVISYQELWEVE